MSEDAIGPGALREFLSHPDRPEGTFGYRELQGFLFAVACAPREVEATEWMPPVFAGQDPGFADQGEAESIITEAVLLYNRIATWVVGEEPGLPPGCEPGATAMADLAEDAPLGEWVRGFTAGHDWLAEAWAQTLSQRLADSQRTLLMVMVPFASRAMAQRFHDEFVEDDTPFDTFIEGLHGLFAESLAEYRALALAVKGGA